MSDLDVPSASVGTVSASGTVSVVGSGVAPTWNSEAAQASSVIVSAKGSGAALPSTGVALAKGSGVGLASTRVALANGSGVALASGAP